MRHSGCYGVGQEVEHARTLLAWAFDVGGVWWERWVQWGGADVGGFLAGIEDIMQHPPTQHSATHAVWGPTNDALATANYKFEIEKVADQSFQYQFSAKLKGA